MKTLFVFLWVLSGVSSFAKEMNFTASTPANREVRDFLMISQGDSIDFIRWKLKIVNLKEFDLSCSYGISKPNTNGFIDEKKVQIKGIVNFSDRTLTLNHHDKSLSMQVLNNNIVHLLNKDGSMMVGNGGWSYTLNSIKPVPDGELKFKSKNAIFKDSIVFEGRTPCRGIEELTEGRTRPECYKKKWLIYLYKSSPSASSGTYKIGSMTSKKGEWKLKEGRSGQIIYSRDLKNGHRLDLLQTDENIVYIMDENGMIMVGDHDFSYSLNRRWK